MFSYFANPALRRMLIPLLMTEFLWGFGSFFVLSTTTLPAYLQSLGAGPVIIGVLATGMGALMVAAQVFGRAIIDRFRRRKRGVILLHVSVIAAYLLIPVLDVLLRDRHRDALIVGILVLLALSQLIIGPVIPVWVDMVGRIVPGEVLGRYFGLASGTFALGGILGGTILTLLTDWLGPNVFRGAFLTAGLCFACSMTAFACTPVPESAFEHPPMPSVWAQVRQAMRACAPGTDLGRLLVSNALLMLALGITTFIVVYAGDPRGLGWSETIFSRMTLWEAFGGAGAALLLGWLVDRTGPRAPWIGFVLVLPAILLLLPFGRSLPVFVVSSLLLGSFIASWGIVGPAILALSPPGDKSGYVALVNLGGLPSTLIGPPLLGWLIGTRGYPTAFVLAGVLALAALIPALLIRPRAPEIAHPPA